LIVYDVIQLKTKITQINFLKIVHIEYKLLVKNTDDFVLIQNRQWTKNILFFIRL